jgi:hypothetical protein
MADCHPIRTLLVHQRSLYGALLACCLLGNSPADCLAENAISSPPGVSKEHFHVYVLLGQSNMAGRGKMTAADRQPAPNVYVLDASGDWRPAAHPLHFDKPSIAGVGLGIDFARAMLESNPNATIGLIPCAVGGTRLDQWSRGGALYETAVARARLGRQAGELKGVLWHQGESDSTKKLAPTYGTRLSAFISDLRRDLEHPGLPFVAGELGHFRQEKNASTSEINRQLAQVAADTRLLRVVSAAGLRDVGDQTHFDSDSLREFGRRYAAEMQLFGGDK